MELLNLFVKVTCKDEASEDIDGIAGGAIGRLASAAVKAAKALAGMWAVKKVVDFGKAAFTAYSQFEQLQGGVAKLYGNAGMSIEEYAQSVGKSVSQVTSDYQRNAEAQAIVMKNAQQAWKTAGMDANTYMQQATSFSASLITSLGGDTKEAARLTDEAMKAMADNVNTFGSDMGSVQNAFQGFAKQNYMMLDNLKLGYGGTKTEMERLIKDASKMKTEQEQLGMTVDGTSMSFDNIVKAIQVVQKHQGIYGTTTKEAMGTIEGSVNATKAAWQNLVTEFGKPDADLGARIADMFTALMGEGGEGGLVRNVVNEVSTIATNMVNALSTAVGQAADWLMANGAQMLSQGLSNMISGITGAGEGIGGLVTSLTDGLVSKAGEIADGVSQLVAQIVPIITEKAPELATAFANLITNGAAAIGENAPKIADKAREILTGFINQVTTMAPQALQAFLGFVGTIGDAIFEILPTLPDKLAEMVSGIVSFVAENGPQVLDAAKTMFGMIGQAIAEKGPEWLSKLGETIGKLIAHIGTFAVEMSNKGREFMMGLLTGTSEEGQNLRKWFADFFPDGLLKAVGDFATLLLDAGKNLIQGVLDGIEEVAPNVGAALKEAFQSVLDFFGGVADFLKDPMGNIENFLNSLAGVSEDTSGKVGDNMQTMQGETHGAMSAMGSDIEKYNSKKLNNKKATAKVDGNAIDGTGKTNVEKTDKAVRNLSGKTVDVTVNQRGMNASLIDDLRNRINSLRDKAITVTTNHVTRNSGGGKKGGGAWGGIRPHATGGVRIADRWGEGEPLDVVGERGPEAIVPLTSRYGKDFARMMGAEAGKYLAGHTLGGSQYNLYYSGEQSAIDMFDDLTFRMQVLEAMGG